MAEGTPISFEQGRRWVRAFSYITLGAVLVGLGAAHVPWIIGTPWSTCSVAGSNLGCVLTFHLYEVPLVSINILVIWYGLRRFSTDALGRYAALLTMTVAANLAFFTFETNLLFDSLRRSAPLWESIGLAVIALLLVSGSALGGYIRLKLERVENEPTNNKETAVMPDTLSIDSDGFYHPTTEDEICELVTYAREEGLQIRCRGAAHSIAHVIYTDPGEGDPQLPNKVSEHTPPNGRNLNVLLDQFTGVEWLDESSGIVEVLAGTHLGKDPEDDSGQASLENGLLYQIFQKGWALNDLGGITHQTVSGFLSTGSAGGSLTYDLGENLLAFRVIDGNGTPRWIDRDEEPDLFNAFGVSMGLLGIISKVRLKLVPMYNVWGQEIVTSADLGKGSAIDLFGSGDSGKPSLEQFLIETPYTRVLWWPQPEIDRIAVWQAARGQNLPVFDPHPYEQFAETLFFTQLQQLGGAILFNLVGNRRFKRIWHNLQNDLRRFHVRVREVWTKRVGKFWAEVFFWILTIMFWPDIFVLTWFFSVCRPCLRWLYPKVVRLLQPFTRRGKSPTFIDYYWRSLPMDNAADDVSLGTEFTEIFIPLEYTERVMQLLKAHFDNNGRSATGYYCVEIYAGYPSEFWMSPSYRERTVRVDLFWYIDNEGDPAASDGFFRQFWDLLRQNDIPFRLHWGKFLPEYDHADWREYFRNRFPKWDDFLELRRLRDPRGVFLTDYWRRHLLGEMD